MASSPSSRSPAPPPLDDFLVRQAASAQKKLTVADARGTAAAVRATHLQQQLMLVREHSEEASKAARREAAARIATGEAASRLARERDAAQLAARRAGERIAELEAERAAIKRVTAELYATNAAVEAENRSLHATLAAQEAALRAAASEREAGQAECARLGAVASAAKEVARQSMEVAAAAEGERDALVVAAARLRKLLKTTTEAALALGVSLPNFVTEE